METTVLFLGAAFLVCVFLYNSAEGVIARLLIACIAFVIAVLGSCAVVIDEIGVHVTAPAKIKPVPMTLVRGPNWSAFSAFFEDTRPNTTDPCSR